MDDVLAASRCGVDGAFGGCDFIECALQFRAELQVAEGEGMVEVVLLFGVGVGDYGGFVRAVAVDGERNGLDGTELVR